MRATTWLRGTVWFGLAIAALAGTPPLAPAAHAATLPYVPLDHWSTECIVDAAGRGLLPGISIADRPYRRADVVRALRDERARADSTRRDYTPYEWWLLERLESEFDPAEPSPAPAFGREVDAWGASIGLEARAAGYAGAAPGRYGTEDVKATLLPMAGFQSGRGLAGGLRFRFDTDGAGVPNFNGREWRDGLTGDARNAYVLLQLGAADIMLGRDDLRWGASENGTLLLSANAPALDQVGIRAKFGPVTASSFFGDLDDMTLDAPVAQAPGDTLAAGTVIRRHISGHRLRWQVNRYLSLGAAEVVVYGGENRAPEAAYMIPVNIYYAAQWNTGKNDNLLGNFTIGLRPRTDLEIYGELLVDDFQIDHSSPADKEPFEGGYLVGERLYNPLGLDGSLFRVEWAKVMPYTFNQVLPWNRYLYKDEVIGFPLGPDAQALDLELRYWMSERVTWTFRFRHEERGETRVTDPWPVPIDGPDEANPFPEHDHVPTGVVETRNRSGAELWLHPRAGVDLRLSGGYLDIQNVENVRDRDQNEWYFEGRLEVAWSRWMGPGR